MKVPWLSKPAIADSAALLVERWETVRGRDAAPPVPVEDIIETGLDLRLGFPDLKSRLKLDDVLGATFVEKRLVCVDRSLLENRFTGRMFFTLAHEAGHWMLHRRHIRGPAAGEAAHFCRAREARTRVEWQADYFASCLLMPEGFVRRAFRETFGRECLSLCNIRPAYSGPLGFDPCVGTWPRIAAAVMEAGGFTNVSRQAMIIRLQDLALVRNETRAHMGWDAAPVTVS